MDTLPKPLDSPLERFETHRRWLSLRTTVQSLQTIRYQSRPLSRSSNGAKLVFMPIASWPVRAEFSRSLAQLQQAWDRPRHRAIQQSDVRFDHLRESFTWLHREEVDSVFVLSPYNEWLLSFLWTNGGWDDFEAWKRGIVDLNESVATALGRPPFPIWDFTGFDPRSMETVPELGVMRWHQNRFLTQMYARFWGGLADPGVGLTAGISQKQPGFRGFCS